MVEEDHILLFGLMACLIMLAIFCLVLVLVNRQNRKFLLQQSQIQLIQSQKQEEIYKAVINAQESERKKIASELHDGIGTELSILKLNLSKYAGDKINQDSEMEDAIVNLDNIIEEIRNICQNLYPNTLKRYGYLELLQNFSERISAASGATCTIENEVVESDLALKYDQKLILYRITQELLNNIMKHSGCTTMKIKGQRNNKTIFITFSHNGIPFVPCRAYEATNDGMGLENLERRILLLPGELVYSNTPEGPSITIKFAACP